MPNYSYRCAECKKKFEIYILTANMGHIRLPAHTAEAKILNGA